MKYSRRTKEECIRSAMHYDSTIQWRKCDSKYYSYARNHGWLEECCQHMPQYKKFHDALLNADTHTKEECHSQAMRYSRRVDWFRAQGSLYSYARTHGWLEICCSHMKRLDPLDNLKMGSGAHTKEECIESARRYTTRQAWHDGASGYYYRAWAMRWLDECCAHMEVHRKNRNTLEECIESASRYTTRKAWREGDGTLYSYAKSHRWTKLCCSHMPDMRFKSENHK